MSTPGLPLWPPQGYAALPATFETNILPDEAGFVDAQARLRQAFGEDCVFLIPAPLGAVVWPIGTPVNPATSKPYDPTILPLGPASGASAVPPGASGVASGAYYAQGAKCTVFFRAITRGAATGDARESEAVGFVPMTHLMLIGDIKDRALMEGAHFVELRGGRFAVSSQKVDGIVGSDRFLTYCHYMGDVDDPIPIGPIAT